MSIASTVDVGLRDRLVRASSSRASWTTVATTLASVVVALAISAVFIAATGGSPGGSLHALLRGSLGSASSITNTLFYAAPLLLVAAGACVCARAGIFNIGQEGQVLMGACFGAWTALRLVIDGPLAPVGVVIGGAVGGAVWALLSALMHRIRGVNIVVSTLLLNFVAVQAVSYIVSKPWLLQESRMPGSAYVNPQSNQILPAARLGSIGQYPSLQLNAGLFIAVGLTVILAILLSRTRWGFRVRMTGLNPHAARHAGVRVALLGSITLVISGAMAGIAGSVLLATPITTNRLDPTLSNNIGWDGLLAALVARNRPLLCVPVALVFGVLRSGGDFLSATGVPFYLVDVVKALLVLALVVPSVAGDAVRRRAVSRAAADTVGQEKAVVAQSTDQKESVA